MNESTLPYFWRMYQLETYNDITGHYFFTPGTKRFFKSRVQTVPPYGGRVFVTSERPWGQPNRLYTVRCIKPGGGIDTLNRFQSRYDAHSFAKWYAKENFVRVGNESVRLPVENKIV